jgi:mRNA-degrading endonuclease toxin of MazEF toxin-antitoxin module
VTGPLRWSILIIDFNPVVGHEQMGERRALVVSYEPFHASGRASVCPISAREPRYPGEVRIAAGQAGQTKDAVILCHQVRTIDLARVRSFEIAGRVQVVTDPAVRREVRSALAHHFGVDIPAREDGASLAAQSD